MYTAHSAGDMSLAMAARPAAAPWQARPAAGQHVDLPRRPFMVKAGARYSLMDDDMRFAPLAYHSPPRFVQRNIVPCGTWCTAARRVGKGCTKAMRGRPCSRPRKGTSLYLFGRKVSVPVAIKPGRSILHSILPLHHHRRVLLSSQTVSRFAFSLHQTQHGALHLL